jgi:hypothetical protein
VVQILPFPLVRRRAFIAKQAAHAALMNPDAGERYVRYQLKIQRDSMLRKGVAEHLIDRELKCLEIAIRTKMVFQHIRPGGAS